MRLDQLHLLEGLIPTFSPQGDGNYRVGDVGYRLQTVDPYLFPARGRKLELLQRPLGFARVVDPYLFPARGRKRTGGTSPCG